MIYTKKIPKADPLVKASLIKQGWITLKEAPNLLIAILLSVPFMILNGLICYGVLYLFNPTYATLVLDTLNASSWAFTIRFDYILYVYLLIVLHELLHLVFIPNFYRSKKTYWGIKLWGGFVYTQEVLTKRRFLVVSLAPFVLLSLIVPMILGWFGWLNMFLLVLVFFNALSSSVDTLNFVTVILQVPNKSLLVNQGFESFYLPKSLQ